ncbi:serine hydrolase domain-containing protein [Chitinophaga qingshengii]|uniref:Beta-lactamase family protein n=1 Tax=Chitinophaga qingshengii TaxID=1569794 RepID=A0ABR7THT6_9BACT|nr:serine hydrolase domain-containing protein [Chitinophaga qingshengii]MBC9929170.1 beta-lactamase family protein [Chitinophaga qingshengii]
MKKYILSVIAILAMTGTTYARQGLDTQRTSRIDDVINRHIHAGHIPGATVLVMRHGQIVYNKAYGYADVASHKPMQTDNIFRIASQTKAVTSLGVMILWEEGKFQLDDPVSMYIPAFKTPRVKVSFNPQDSSYTTRPASREITVRDLLRHTSGIAYAAVFSDPQMQAIYAKAGVVSGIGTMASDLKTKMTLLAQQPLMHDPGQAFTYGLNTDLLGYLIEIWSGQPLDVFLQQRVFKPLDMQDTYFHLPAAKQQKLVTLYEEVNGKMLPVTHPLYEGVDPLFPNRQGTYLSGGAGLVSTTADYAKFLSVFMNKGKYNKRTIISPATVALMLTNQLEAGVRPSPLPAQPEPFQFGLGFALETAVNDHLMPYRIGTFSWGGAFNTHYWADPQEGLIGLVFTQEYLSPYWSIGDEFKTAVYQALD